MSDLLEAEFLRLLTESPSEASNEKMRNAYGQFVKQVENLDRSETYFSVTLQTLNVARSDLLKFLFLQSNQPVGKAVKPYKSEVYFIPKTNEGVGIDSMGEFTVSFDLSRHFFDEERKFNLEILVGNLKSVNLDPTVIIYRNV
ncbi:MAG: hypothetical protein LBB62_05625 [Proteiniphilum sp.]|nr:hypothetical protein [Proteiniphilum sp.]